jgi:predicted RNase H-like HicB family nuclease
MRIAPGGVVPRSPGCFSAADTLDEVLPNACEALELWFEDRATSRRAAWKRFVPMSRKNWLPVPF